MMNFQSESKKSGDAFEGIVFDDLLQKNFKTIWEDVEIPDTGCEVDFIAQSWQFTEYIEAKGGIEGEKKRPGAKRTDNVKKAIANGALIKSVEPNAYYVIYFSAQPEPGSYSDKMITAALKAKFIDEVRYIEVPNAIIEETTEGVNMLLDQGQGYLTEWYENNDGVKVRDFVFRDFGNWIWNVKQFSDNNDTSKIAKNIAYQTNPNTGEIVLRDVTGICNKALRPENPFWNELQFSHACTCCN